MSEPNFFTDHSPFLRHPLLTPARTGREVAFILRTVPLAPGALVLDVGCGWGRHSIALAQRGFRVVGIDPAAAMVASARERAAAAGVTVAFQQAPAARFQTSEPFDMAICLFTTLGQISASGENSQGLLTAVHRALKPGGAFVVEVPQRETAVSQLRETDKFGEGERYTVVTRRFDDRTNTIHETFDVVDPVQKRRFRLAYRLFAQEELVQVLAEAGFVVSLLAGNDEGTPLQPDHGTMWAFAEAS